MLSACEPVSQALSTSTDQPRVLTIMAASSLTEAFTELAAGFEKEHPDIMVAFNFAGSQQLAQQLANGARADIFASANFNQMDVAVENGRVNKGAPIVFAQNRLVVIFPGENPGKINALADLAKPGIKILLAAPEVPVGQYSLEFLDKASQLSEYGVEFKARVLANVVSYETTVKAVVVKAGLGEADAGIVYATDVTPANRSELGSIEIPVDLNVIGEYYIAQVADGDAGVAGLWIEYLLSETGKAGLKNFGFQPVEK